eukprot:CAMPEP_0171200488 /NCGR_PEP_ID=MMETSP0790-20130122/24004_1 /TAXON_ID=2925 /ORGANISM="Alexandrium catenella, Strain OF101" /LENGTH=409 /DNA_ID=CAMNT_0011665865 /DNA_START=34 /DNA_END=1261 /DNA_ORIENTATION=+
MAVTTKVLLTDRLAEFQQLAASKGSLVVGSSAGGSASSRSARELAARGRDRMGRARLLQASSSSSATVSAPASFMREFFDAVSQVQATLKLGRDGVEAMGKMLEDALQATTQDRQKTVSDRLAQQVEEVHRHVARAKLQLEELQARSDAEDKLKPGSAECRIRANMQQAMLKKHQQLLLDFQKAQLDLKHMLERQQAREMQLLCPEATEQEVQEMIEAGETSSQMVMRKMAGAHAVILDEVQRIRDKHNDILRLEQSIQDLAQMFNEIALLVNSQGEMLDAIEVHVNNTHEYTNKAVKELVVAKKTQSNTRKWTCCLTVFLMVLVIVISSPSSSAEDGSCLPDAASGGQLLRPPVGLRSYAPHLFLHALPPSELFQQTQLGLRQDFRMWRAACVRPMLTAVAVMMQHLG